MDQLIHNLNKNQLYESVLIRDGIIHAVGSFHLLQNIATNGKLIDLKGNLLLPAFTDAHTHFVETAKQQLNLDLKDCNSENTFYQKLIDFRDKNEILNLKWIKGSNLEIKNIEKYPNINKDMLDKVFPDIPVSIASRDLHSNMCNSKAINVLAENGVIINNNGFFYENSWSILDKFIPSIDEKILKELVKKLIQQCHKYGLCGVHSFEDKFAARLIQEISEEEHFYFTWYYLLDDETLISYEKENKHFRNAGIKFFTDGSLGSNTAWLFENQHDDQKMAIENMSQIVNAHLNNQQIAIHAIGDYAVYLTCKMFIELNRKYGFKQKHRIEHLQAVRPEDICLLNEANVHASMQPIHIKEDLELLNRKWKIAKDYSFPIKSIANVVDLAFGSDSPVETLNPFDGIKYAVNRDKFLPEEAITIEQAIDAYSYKHHVVANKPISYGKIEKGQIANLIAVNENIIDNYETEMTMIDGVIIQ